MHDLLNDPIIRIEHQQQRSSVCLPELLARLQQGAVDAYPGLRAHQADPWHVFLVQLAAAVLSRTELPTRDPVPQDAVWWRAQLLALAEGKASAWHLVEPDVAQPAFMQHPWRKGMEEAGDYGIQINKRGQQTLNAKAETPDDLDVLITAKNHDLKSGLCSQSDVEAWLYGLILFQTTSGYLGAGNFGITRMNGGFASRSCLSWVTDARAGPRFCEELPVVLAMRAQSINKYGYRADGVVLTWLSAWDRSTHQYMLFDLDPLYIEACRPVRLWPASDTNLCALSASSQARQIGPKNLDNGDVGDPWTALNVEGRKGGNKSTTALTLSANGFTPKLVTDLLLQQGYELTPLQVPRTHKKAGWLLASVIVRGQGKTGGFQRIEIPVPAKVAPTLFAPKNNAARVRAAQNALQLLSDAKAAAAALRSALFVLTEGGPEDIDYDRDAIKRWTTSALYSFDQAWPPIYYPTLWRVCDPADAQSAQSEWRNDLTSLVRAQLDLALEKLPLSSNRIWRARTQALSMMHAILIKHHLLDPNVQTAKEAP